MMMTMQLTMIAEDDEIDYDIECDLLSVNDLRVADEVVLYIS